MILSLSLPAARRYLGPSLCWNTKRQQKSTPNTLIVWWTLQGLPL